MVTLMTKHHLNDVVSVHMQSFKGFFLTFLGERFLQLYYMGLLKHEHAIKLVYVENYKVKGFVVGTMAPAGFYTTLLRRDWLRFGMASVPAIIKRPKSFVRLLRAFARASNAPKDSRVAELSSIAVLPNNQCNGIGRELVSAFLREVKGRGGRNVYLTTDARNNDRVNAFYLKNGFRIERVIDTRINRLMNEFWFDIR